MTDYNYATVTDVENLLLVDIDASFEAQVNSWISAAESYVNDFTGYTTASGLWNEQIVDETIEARVDGGLNLVVYPRKRPINSVSSLALWKGSNSINLTLSGSDGNTKYIKPAQNNCLIYPNYEIATTSSSFSINDFSQIKFSRWFTKLSYIAGYTTIPKDVTLATAMITSESFMRHSNREGLSAITQGKISKRWGSVKGNIGKSDILVDAENILMGYKIGSGWF